MKTFLEYIEKRFLTEDGIGAPGALPPGGAPPGGPPGGAPPGGPMGGPPGLGGPPGGGLGGPGGPGMGGPGGGADLAGKKPLELKPLDVWSVLERILGLEKEERPQSQNKQQPSQHKYLQS